MSHPATTEHTFFSGSHDAFTNIDHILGHKTHRNKLERIEITQSTVDPWTNKFELHKSTYMQILKNQYSVSPPHPQVSHPWIQTTVDWKENLWSQVGNGLISEGQFKLYADFQWGGGWQALVNGAPNSCPELFKSKFYTLRPQKLN